VIIDKAMVVLRAIYKNIPNPSNYQVTRWGQDKFTLGSYSFTAYGQTFEDYDILAEPVNNKLFFAGEATIGIYMGTVHGAYMSGERAAIEVLKSHSITPQDIKISKDNSID